MLIYIVTQTLQIVNLIQLMLYYILVELKLPFIFHRINNTNRHLNKLLFPLIVFDVNCFVLFSLRRSEISNFSILCKKKLTSLKLIHICYV